MIWLRNQTEQFTGLVLISWFWKDILAIQDCINENEDSIHYGGKVTLYKFKVPDVGAEYQSMCFSYSVVKWLSVSIWFWILENMPKLMEEETLLIVEGGTLFRIYKCMME